MSIKSILLWRILPSIALALACFVGYLSQHELPVGLFFTIIIPASNGVLPPQIFGHGKMKGTPEVPDDLSPQPRPENEMFLTLPGSGDLMPQNGVGMCCRPTAYDDELVYRSTLWHLLLGGRHIDGAQLYLNSKAVGRGIREAMRRGVKREEIFLTSKIFPTHYGYESTMKVVKSELDDLGLDYIDLFLLHFPSSGPLGSPCSKEGKGISQCRKETWQALSELRNKGNIRNTGVSNFAVKHIQELEAMTDVAPVANNQISFSPFVPEKTMETVEYCHQRNITVTAYMPLGGQHQRSLVMRDLAGLSTKLGKSVSQIMLRWAIQSGCAVIPGTGNPNHMKENLSVYEIELSDAEMKQINELKYNAKGYMNMDTNMFD